MLLEMEKIPLGPRMYQTNHLKSYYERVKLFHVLFSYKNYFFPDEQADPFKTITRLNTQ